MKEKFDAPKGTKDFLPGYMEVRSSIISKIEKIFRRYGFYEWDGPAFEYLNTLTRKSGEEVKDEIYVFKDKGGRELGLRFELTASIARMIANNPHLKKPVKGYSIGKVWRYENPQKGRYREFLQMDADIFGSGSMFCEVELLNMGKQILEEIGFKDKEYYIRLNNRKVLEAQVRCSGVCEEKKMDIFRALDKMDKIGYEGVKKEFLNKGLSVEDFEGFMSYIISDGSNREKIEEMCNLLKGDEKGMEGLNELSHILKITDEIGLSDILVDYTLARGLDYYTGPIYEIKIKKGEEVGSIAGGGRYDQLVELFGGNPTPAVGISFGIERIIDIIEKDRFLSKVFKIKAPIVFVVYIEAEFFNHAFKIVENIRKEGISADIDLTMRPFKKQLKYANERGYPYVLFVGEEEIRTKRYGLKDMESGEQVSLKFEEVIEKLKEGKNQ